MFDLKDVEVMTLMMSLKKQRYSIFTGFSLLLFVSVGMLAWVLINIEN